MHNEYEIKKWEYMDNYEMYEIANGSKETVAEMLNHEEIKKMMKSQLKTINEYDNEVVELVIRFFLLPNDINKINEICINKTDK